MDRRGFLAHLGASTVGCMAAQAGVAEPKASHGVDSWNAGPLCDFDFRLARAYHADDYLHCTMQQIDLAGPMGPRYQVYSQEIRETTRA